MTSILFGPCEIEELREEFTGFLSDVCTVYSPTRESDGMGGNPLTYPVSGPSYPCRLHTNVEQGKEEMMTNRQQVTLPYTVILPVGTTVKQEDRIGVLGLLLEVVSVGIYSDAITLPVECVRVR